MVFIFFSRNFLFVEDVARAFEIILFKGKVGVVYNIGGSNERANIDVAKDLIRLAGYTDGMVMITFGNIFILLHSLFMHLQMSVYLNISLCYIHIYVI
jgi:nucleoside-diphosphate-sugar epimerase